MIANTTITEDERWAMFAELKSRGVAHYTPSEKWEREIWQKAFNLYNKGTGHNYTDLTCQKCCNHVLEWLQP